MRSGPQRVFRLTSTCMQGSIEILSIQPDIGITLLFSQIWHAYRILPKKLRTLSITEIILLEQLQLRRLHQRAMVGRFTRILTSRRFIGDTDCQSFFQSGDQTGYSLSAVSLHVERPSLNGKDLPDCGSYAGSRTWTQNGCQKNWLSPGRMV